MKKGIFPILKRRETHEVFNINLPPKFLKFLQEYDLGNNFYNRNLFLHQDELFPFSNLSFNKQILDENYHNSFSQLFDEKLLVKELDSCSNFKVNEGRYKGFIKIGYFDKADTILLGIEQSNYDEIWIIAGDLGYERPDILKIANDIIDFLDNCNEEIFELNLEVKGLTISQLYRNWNEDFWRVREDEKPS